MKKKYLLLLLILLCGCAQPIDKSTSLRILSPFGAPSIALLDEINKSNHQITNVSGTDLLLANLINQTPSYELIVAPINVGLTLIQNNQTHYRLLSVLTWGNLYLVGYDESDLTSNETVALFGKDAVPEKIINHSIQPNQLTMKQQYFGSMMDTQAQLLSQQVRVALLAEPLVSATLKQNNDLKILIDIQQQYQQATGFDNYPQAALFVLESFYQENRTAVNQFVTGLIDYNNLITNDSNQLEIDLNNTDLTVLGLPPAPIVKEAFSRMNIRVVFANDVRQEIQRFMDLFNFEVNDHMIVQ